MADKVNDILDGGFKQGLCGCFTDPTECVLTCVFPFYAIGMYLARNSWKYVTKLTKPDKPTENFVLTPRFSRWQLFATCVFCNFPINFVF